jgi:hypothetical protein
MGVARRGTTGGNARTGSLIKKNLAGERAKVIRSGCGHHMADIRSQAILGARDSQLATPAPRATATAAVSRCILAHVLMPPRPLALRTGNPTPSCARKPNSTREQGLVFEGSPERLLSDALPQRLLAICQRFFGIRRRGIDVK